jgi:hypothetical protein
MSIKRIKLREARNRPPPDEPWVWFTREMLESEAWCSCSIAERRVLDRVMIEHMAHAGTENGNLAVTYSDFVKFGIRRQSVPGAIRAAAAKGLLIVTAKGRRSSGPDRWPARYALGWLSLADGSPAMNRWKAWRKCRRSLPIGGNIESSTGSGTRENGRNPGALVPETTLAPGTGNDTRELQKSANA